MTLSSTASLDASALDLQVVVSRADVAGRVRELAAALAVGASARPLALLAVLAGGLTFARDLSAALAVPHRPCAVAVGGYAAAAGRLSIRLSFDDGAPIAGAHVVVVDDLVHTGLTLRSVVHAVRERGAARVECCVLLDRPYRRLVPGLPLTHVGFTVPDVPLVGYGGDVDGAGRSLPDICRLAG